MTVFHIIGYWYLALSLVAIAFGLTMALLYWIGAVAWNRMRRTRDVWVLHWWIWALNKTGVTVPTKANIDKLMAFVRKHDAEETAQ